MALRWMFLLLLTPLLAAQNNGNPYARNHGKPQERGRCPAPSDWDPKLQFKPRRSSYALNEVVQLSCVGEPVPSVPRIQCISRGTRILWNDTATCKERCQRPRWDSQLQLSPDQSFYWVGEEVTVSCFMNNAPPLSVIRCANKLFRNWKDAWEVNIWGSWQRLAEDLTCPMEKCPKPQWDERLQFSEDESEYPQNRELTLTCPEGLELSFPEVKCTKELQVISDEETVYGDVWWGRNSAGAWTRIEGDVLCMEMCQRPLWDSRLQLAPDQKNYGKDEKVMLSCPGGLQPSFTEIKCQSQFQDNYYDQPVYRQFWLGRDSSDSWVAIQSHVECIEMCQRPLWDSRLQLAPDQKNYGKDEKVMLSCPGGLQPSFTEIKCQSQFQDNYYDQPVYRQFWLGRDSSDSWVAIQSHVECIEMCQRPLWDSRLQLAPDQKNYGKDEKVMLSCPGGLQPSFTEIKCQSQFQDNYYDPPVYRQFWLGRDSSDSWVAIQSHVECIEVLQVVPGTFEISSTSIKLNWTCRFPDACQGMRAMCRLAAPSSPPCEAEEVNGEQMLHGQAGTFTCSPLQPFTEYSVTISLPPNETLFSWLFMTEETVPDKPEELWLDPNRGSLRWKALPSCKGEIIGYQLSITARNAGDSGVLEMERLRLNGSVTEHRLPEHSPGRSYAVTIRGLTAAGAGAALAREFPTGSSDTPHPQGISCRSVRDIAPSQGTAVLPLRPIARPSEAAREHQLIVATTHDGSVTESICAGQPQLFNGSVYLAALLNLTAPTDFVLGDGSRGQGHHNAALRPGCDYTALLRLVRLSPQAEKFTCVCYSFSVGQEPSSLLDRKPVVMAVALAVGCLALGILLLFVLFRLKHNRSKASENNSTIPLRGCQKVPADVRKPNTQILVEELLEALKMFKREEMEAEQTDDESVDRHGAGLLREYQQLSSTLLHPCNAGKELCNQYKNRYKSIIPYDHCRVVLQPSDTGNGYINASYVDSYRSPRFFIAAQGPLAGTVVDFWQMVWQEKTSVIVMLTGLVEQNKIKCEQYWPEQEQVYGDFTVTLNNTWTTTGLVKRIFCLQKAGCALPRAVEQFHYLLWPDHGVPRNPSQLLYLVEVVNKRVLEAPAGPVLVHCSAGIGRTGTFIALDFLLKMGKAEGKVDVFHCVQQLREQRVSMVQTKEQYSFLYEALLEGLLCGNTGVPVESISTLVHSLREDETSGHNSVLEKEFKALQSFSELFQLLPCREAEKPRNQPKNRKPGILPADSCRPILMSSVNADGSPAYINAVFASTYTEEERIIITQLPFPTTLVDFWALVWDYTCTSVVVLNQLQELDKTYVLFWPTQGEDDYGRFHVQLISEEPGAGFTTWTLVLSNRQQRTAAVDGVCAYWWFMEGDNYCRQLDMGLVSV
ncbi:receptor-type tyrosine-protein phosphatase kappa-like isoform X4 [Corvus hawaiiensis]|uniref:receptor-type tyrosine-protein phosphatase kappa-like isoform X4 n=1 Tax=Corvus hawaiiensis TaxID=134902 RepID=UPI002018ED65|nr:receptor-type tyrosine-protein phosphatase kappa-like isoform X4 [Corvus hawaiiensis]